MFSNPRQRYEARMSEARQYRHLACWMHQNAVKKNMQGIYVNAKQNRIQDAKAALRSAKTERRQHPSWFKGAYA